MWGENGFVSQRCGGGGEEFIKRKSQFERKTEKMKYLQGIGIRVRVMLGVLAMGSGISIGSGYDFNDEAQYTDAFYKAGLGTVLNYSASGGIGDSGWVTLGNPNNSIPGMLVANQKVSADGDSISLGVSFYWEGASGALGTGHNDVIWVGIGKSGDPDIPFLPRNSGSDPLAIESAQELRIALRLPPKGDGSTVDFRVSGSKDQTRFWGGDNGSTVSLTEGEWYRLEATFSKAVISTGWDISVDLMEMSASGEKGDNIMSWTTPSQYNEALTSGDVNVLVGTRAQRFSNIKGFDDFIVIPEPTIGALAVGGVLFMAMLRGRNIEK